MKPYKLMGFQLPTSLQLVSLPDFSFTFQATDKKHDNLPPPENERGFSYAKRH